MIDSKARPFVAVTWGDAHSAGATSAFEIHELPHKALEITTYGLLLRHDEVGVTVAGEDCGGGTYRNLTFVPAAMLVSVKHITKPHKKKPKVAVELTPPTKVE